MSQFVFESSHQIYFNTKEPIPVGEIAKSLLAIERLILSSTAAMEGVTAVEIDKISVFVSKIEAGSLYEDIVVKFFFKDQAGLDAFIEKVRNKVREPGMPRNIVIGAVIAAVVGAGAYYASSLSKGSGQTTITANNNVIINIGAGEVGMTPEAFKAVVDTAIKDKKALAENTVQFFKPARIDRGSSITFDDSDSLKFSPDVIQATPATLKLEKAEHSKDYSDVDLEIRATDLDSQKRGWAGVITGLVDRRIPLKLAENVKTSDLNHFRVRADVTIFYKRQSRGSGSELVPDYVLVRNVIQ